MHGGRIAEPIFLPLDYNSPMENNTQNVTENKKHEQGNDASSEIRYEGDLAVILASASPRRKQLLEEAGVKFQVKTCEVDESLEPDLQAQPQEGAKKLAEKKAGAVVQEVLGSDFRGAAVVIGADTMVVFDNEIFGKPHSVSEATGMLRKLSGKTHEVVTAVSVWMVAAQDPEKVSLGFRTFAETSRVTFKELSDEQISAYLRCGESFDKAGAYGIQGEGKELVEKVEGDIETVIGLPVGRLLQEFPDLRAQ